MHRTLLSLSHASQLQVNTSLLLVKVGWQCRVPSTARNPPLKFSSSTSGRDKNGPDSPMSSPSIKAAPTRSFSPSTPGPSPSPSQILSIQPGTPPPDWDENPDYNILAMADLPSRDFGVNQHMNINEEFKEALRQILWQFRAPIRYAFAYGSGVFPQTGSSSSSSSKGSALHPNPSPAVSSIQRGNGKMIDFIFGVSYTQHWHSLNLRQHRGHYSAVGSLGSYCVSRIQDGWGAGVYFNPYITVNGTLIKYGVVNLDTLCRDLSEWDTMYLAGRLQKPVKILRDEPRVRFANQVNLISAVRTALLLLPPNFTEQDFYETITGISYLGDPRMYLGAENLNKVSNIVKHQLPHFRKLYAPLISNLPNIAFSDPRCSSPSWVHDPETNAKMDQDMDPVKRGNMVRRLPKNFRDRLYFQYQSKFQIPRLEFNKMMEHSSDEDPSWVKHKRGGEFEQRIAGDEKGSLNKEVSAVINKVVRWPSYSQSMKGLITSGIKKSWSYLMEKSKKNQEGRKKDPKKWSDNANGEQENPPVNSHKRDTS